MSKRPVQKHLVHVLMLSLVIMLVGGGMALLYQWQQKPLPSHASSSDNVVGPPSLPASYVDKIFRSLGSPMVGTGAVVEQASRAQNIDDAFALAVWWTETNDGAAGVGLHDRNPGSVRGSVGYPSAYDGYTIYPSYSAAVTYWFGMMKRMYINRGRTTVSAISHPYVGTSTSNLWAGKVTALMLKYRAEAPKIPVTPTVNATATKAAQIATQQATIPTPQSQVVVHLQSTTQNQQAQSTGGLNGTTKTLLVIFDLLLALGLGLWARSMLKRYSNSVQISSLLNADRQEKGFQQQSGIFNTFTGGLRTTEDLQWPAPTTSALGTTNAALPTYSSDALFEMGVFMAQQAQGQYQAPATPQPGRSLGIGLPNRTTPSPLHRTRLMPSQPNTDQFPSFAADPSSSQTQPQPVLAETSIGGRSNGLLSRYRETQAQDEQQQGF